MSQLFFLTEKFFLIFTDSFLIVCLTKRLGEGMWSVHCRLTAISKNNPTTHLSSIVFIYSCIWRTAHRQHTKCPFSLCFKVWNYSMYRKLGGFISTAPSASLHAFSQNCEQILLVLKGLRNYEPLFNIPDNHSLSSLFNFSLKSPLLPRLSLSLSTSIKR